MTGIINYGAGNIFSVINCLQKLNENTLIVSNPKKLSEVHRIILPGVGAFDQGIRFLKKYGLIDVIYTEIKKGKPLLGICLGLQILFEKSQEGKLKGLGVLKGEVKKFPEKKRFFVPHMGWNSVKIVKNSDFLKGIPDRNLFYFAHSFYPVPDESDIIYGTTEYGIEFTSIVQKENVIGVQFHPEKSSEYGLLLIKNFLKMK